MPCSGPWTPVPETCPHGELLRHRRDIPLAVYPLWPAQRCILHVRGHVNPLRGTAWVGNLGEVVSVPQA